MEVKSKSVGIVGTGFYVPEKVLTNFDLEKIVDTTDEWIRTRTGIRERRIAAADEAVSIPIALAEAAKEGKIKEGAIVVLTAFGGGLTWGACVIRW